MYAVTKCEIVLLKSLSVRITTVEIVEPRFLIVVHALRVHCVAPDQVKLRVLLHLVLFNQLLLRRNTILEDAYDQHSQPCCRLHDVLTLFVEECFVVLLDNVSQPDHALY